MKLPDKVYDIIKWICIVVLPACATLVSVILPLWDLACAETVTAIVGTITALDAFLGALLGVSTAEYRKEE